MTQVGEDKLCYECHLYSYTPKMNLRQLEGFTEKPPRPPKIQVHMNKGILSICSPRPRPVVFLHSNTAHRDIVAVIALIEHIWGAVGEKKN